MSRIGKQPIFLPSGVTVHVTDGVIIVKGPKGELSRQIHPAIRVEVVSGEILVSPARSGIKNAGALWGLTRALVANMVVGVTSGYEKVLEFEGIGYRAAMEGMMLVLQLGFSHPVRFEAPKGITIVVQKNTITITGIDKELVGETAARVRRLKKPEPYKGKGIRYRGEIIRRKAGKKTVASA